jgi:3-phosphoshikimate 1-carboxyvinyltransferase
VPGDPSSAAFFAALAALAPTASCSARRLRQRDAHRIPRRAAEMGATSRCATSARSGEWVAERARVGGRSCAVTIVAEAIPTLIDELPPARVHRDVRGGETRVTGAEELRVKESDRISAVVDNLETLGADAEELARRLRRARDTNRGCADGHDARRPSSRDGVRRPRRHPGQRDRHRRPECVAVSYPDVLGRPRRVTA